MIIRFYQKCIEVITSHVALYHILSGGSIVGIGAVSIVMARATNWITDYGPIGWWFAGLFGMLIAGFIILVIFWIRSRIVYSFTLKEWKNIARNINPLEREFIKQRIKISELANPFDKKIENKRFIDCELLGPAILFAYKNCSMTGTIFMGCDVVVLKEGARIQNAVILENVEILSGKIYSCTIYISQSQVHNFQEMGPNILTLTGDPTIDNQPSAAL